MTDQTAPPQDMPDGTAIEIPLMATNALLRAVRVCAENAAGEDRAAEAKDYGAAALAFAQAAVVLDPTRIGSSGDTAETRKAAAPTPAPRDGNKNGRING